MPAEPTLRPIQVYAGRRRFLLLAAALTMVAAALLLLTPSVQRAGADVSSGDVVGFDRSPVGGGYRMVTATGRAFTLGSLPNVASFSGSLNQPIVSAVNTPSGAGLWSVAADGGVFTAGDAPFLGSMGGQRLNAPIVDIARAPSGRGIWLAASDGGVFAFGPDAPFLGSMGGQRLNSPVVAMAAMLSGRGYLLVAADGGAFAFGDQPFRGSLGSLKLNAPIVDAAVYPDGSYVMLGRDGGVFTFGHPFLGNALQHLQAGVRAVRISRASDGPGYSIVTNTGQTYNFGTSAHGNPDADGGGPSTNGTLRDRIANIARAELAKKPAERNGNNVVRYGGGTGALAPYSTGQSWCADFATWVWTTAGVGNPHMNNCGKVDKKGQPMTNTIQFWAANNRTYRPLSAGPRVGDLLLFGRPGACNHVTIVVGVRSDGWVQTIGGNESNRVKFDDWTPPSKLPYGTAYGYASPIRGE